MSDENKKISRKENIEEFMNLLLYLREKIDSILNLIKNKKSELFFFLSKLKQALNNLNNDSDHEEIISEIKKILNGLLAFVEKLENELPNSNKNNNFTNNEKKQQIKSTKEEK